MNDTPTAARKQDAALSTVESKDLRSLEQVIERVQKSFLEAGKALLAIKAQKLYRQDYKTFAEYCTDRWGFAKSRAYQMIDAAKVMENVQHVGQIAPPANARQACELAKLPADQQANAWADAVDECRERGVPVTAAAVAEVVDRYRAQDEPPKTEPRDYYSTLPVDAELLAVNPELSADQELYALSLEDPSYFCEVYPSIKNPGYYHLVIHEDLDTDNASVVYDRRGVKYDRRLLAWALVRHGHKPMDWGTRPATGQEFWAVTCGGRPASGYRRGTL
ncbi:MAG: hypothetical protein WCJ35_28645 [Planctomycetota bacterium]